MIAAWMLYAVLVGVLVALAARALEEVCGFVGVGRRFVWLAALLAVVGLTVVAPFRESARSHALGEVWPEAVTVADARPTSPGAEAWRSSGLFALAAMVAEMRQAAERPLRAVASPVGGRLDMALIAVWAVLALGVFGVGLATLARSRVTRRGWPRGELAGASVRVSPSTGPAVVGVVRPEIVVPRWLVGAPAEARRVAVLHEMEHIRARDPLILAASWLCVALVPWNPVVWWLLARLRLAIELDCDRRVLAHGVGPATYGSLLIDAAQHRSAPLAAAILAASPSTLERRLITMSARLPRFAVARAALAGIVALAAAVAACDARLPTGEQIEAMDAETFEAVAVRLGLTSPDGNSEVRVFVDGEFRGGMDEVRNFLAEEIASIGVRRAGEGQPTQIYLRTHAYNEATRAEEAEAAAATGEGLVVLEAGDVELRGGTLGLRGLDGSVTVTSRRGGGADAEPLFLIDGVVADPGTLERLAPDLIESIDVLKGAAANQAYDDPRAANGVVRITTRGADGTPRH